QRSSLPVPIPLSITLLYTTFSFSSLFFFNATAPPEIYTLSLHDALPIWPTGSACLPRGEKDLGRLTCSRAPADPLRSARPLHVRSEEHTSELQSRSDLVCRLLLEKKKNVSLRSTSLTSGFTPLRASSSSS